MLRQRLVLTLLVMCCMGPTCGETPVPDFANFSGYMQALQQSRDPQARAFLQEIAAGPAALNKERAAARFAGVVLDLSAMGRALPAPDRNGAVAYQRLKSLLVQKPLEMPIYAEPLSDGYVYTAPEIAAAQQIVDSRADVFQPLHDMARMPVWVFPMDWSQGATVQFPQVANLRASARDLDTESFLLAKQGKLERAMETQATGLELGRHVASTPLLINDLIGTAIDNITLSGFKSLLCLAGPNADVDTQVQRAILTNAFPGSLQATLSGQVSVELSQLEEMRTTLASTQALPADQAVLLNDLVDAAQARQLAVMLSLIRVADRPDPERRAVFDTVTRTEAAADTGLDPVIALDDLVAFTNFKFLAKLDDRVHAQERVTLAGAAVLADKARTERFPASLPGSFTDPYTGRPLVYRKEGAAGFVVYSVGPDGTFDGSDPGPFRLIPDNAFFRYPAPPPQPVTAEMMVPDL